ncbi:hypothetical protein LY76DRAFT_673503 [Colletotrichum caudatum]|nr:hypothetical protein LY76DRAFT_673503 [Colletotrichum caudatum]
MILYHVRGLCEPLTLTLANKMWSPSRSQLSACPPTHSSVYRQQEYIAALNNVVSKDLLLQESQFLGQFNGRLYSPPSTPSITLTDIDLDQRGDQPPSHSAKIVDMYKEEVRTGDIGGRKTRRGTRGGASKKNKQHMAPLSPPKPMPNFRALASDASDIMASSNASTNNLLHYDRSPLSLRDGYSDNDEQEPVHNRGASTLLPSTAADSRQAASSPRPLLALLEQPMSSQTQPPLTTTLPHHPFITRPKTELLQQLNDVKDKYDKAQEEYRIHAKAEVDLDAKISGIRASMLRFSYEAKASAA